MALDKGTLKTTFVAIMTDMLTREETSIDEYAERWSDAIDVFVRSGKVNAGITVSTTGTAFAHTGATTSEGTIS